MLLTLDVSDLKFRADEGEGGRSEGGEGGDRFLRGSIKLRAGFGVNYFRSRSDCLTGAGLRLDVNWGN